jgi:signal transduction histidine kinase
MTQAERERAFLRFGTGSVRGSGLGLAIVHRLVSSSAGEARLSPTPGGGLTVTLELPGPGRAASQLGRQPRQATSQESTL